MTALFAAAGIYAAVALSVLWLLVMADIMRSAFGPQPGLDGPSSLPRPQPPSVALTERIQATWERRSLALPVASWCPTT